MDTNTISIEKPYRIYIYYQFPSIIYIHYRTLLCSFPLFSSSSQYSIAFLLRIFKKKKYNSWNLKDILSFSFLYIIRTYILSLEKSIQVYIICKQEIRCFGMPSFWLRVKSFLLYYDSGIAARKFLSVSFLIIYRDFYIIAAGFLLYRQLSIFWNIRTSFSMTLLYTYTVPLLHRK